MLLVFIPTMSCGFPSSPIQATAKRLERVPQRVRHKPRRQSYELFLKLQRNWQEICVVAQKWQIALFPIPRKNREEVILLFPFSRVI